MRVESVSLTLGKSRLTAVVTDDGGSRRRITFQWFEKDSEGVPPSGWMSSLSGECEYQRAEELAAKRGVIP